MSSPADSGDFHYLTTNNKWSNLNKVNITRKNRMDWSKSHKEFCLLREDANEANKRLQKMESFIPNIDEPKRETSSWSQKFWAKNSSHRPTWLSVATTENSSPNCNFITNFTTAEKKEDDPNDFTILQRNSTHELLVRDVAHDDYANGLLDLTHLGVQNR